MKAVGGIPAGLFFLVYLQNPLTYCNKYDIIKISKGGEENGAGHRKGLQELSKAIENNEAVESVVIKITLKKQKSDKASNPKESK